MKLITLFISAGLLAIAHGAVCPFEDLRRSGLLSAEDAAKFDAVKRNPAAAETFIETHKQKDKSKEKRQGLISPIINGILDLPLGGGLRK